MLPRSKNQREPVDNKRCPYYSQRSRSLHSLWLSLVYNQNLLPIDTVPRTIVYNKALSGICETGSNNSH